MIIDIIDDETIEIYGETAELANKNSRRFVKIATGYERWLSSKSQFGSCMDETKRYKVIIKLTKKEYEK